MTFQGLIKKCCKCWEMDFRQVDTKTIEALQKLKGQSQTKIQDYITNMHINTDVKKDTIGDIMTNYLAKGLDNHIVLGSRKYDFFSEPNIFALGAFILIFSLLVMNLRSR